MKKILFILLTVCISLSALLFASCGEHEHSYKEWTTTETQHYKVCTVKGCEVKNFEGYHSFAGLTCSVCHYVEVLDKTATPEDVNKVLNNVKDGATITLTSGVYTTANLVAKNNITIKGQDGVVFEDNLKLMGDCENITIEGVLFNKPVPDNYNTSMEEGGVRILGSINGLTIKNCTFTNFSNTKVILNEEDPQVLTNLTFESCIFEELANGKNTLSSVYIGCIIDNITVNNCVFDNIEYDGLQLSGTVRGNVNFTNTTYRNIGARYFNINNAPNVNWNISSNKFYASSSQSFGKYFKGSNLTGTTFNIGINQWEQIPVLDVEYFAIFDNLGITGEKCVIDGITYDEEAQLPITD